MASADELEPELDTGASTGADALASAIAADAARSDPAVARLAARLIDAQTELVRLQQGKLREEATTQKDEQRLALSHLRARRFGDYSRMALEMSAGLIALMVLVGVAGMVFNAMQAHELVFDELGVPPDLAARGITGKALSTQLLDRYASIDSGTTSISQDAETFRSGVGGNIRIAIPNAGISLGELDQYLRDWLGSETHISGDIVHTEKGLALTVRLGRIPGKRFESSTRDIDSLVKSAAESLYAQALPLRYADYLAQNGRFDEAVGILKPLSQYGPAQQRAQALASWSELLSYSGDLRGSLDLATMAVRLSPNVLYTQWVLADAEWNIGHEERTIAADDAVARIAKGMSRTVSADINGWRWYQSLKFQIVGDYANSVEILDRLTATTQVSPNYASLILLGRLLSYIGEHDETSARIAQTALPDPVWTYPPHFGAVWTAAANDIERQDWLSAVAHGQKAIAIAKDRPDLASVLLGNRFGIRPMLAVAYAHLGNFSRADESISATALDCDACVRARGTIAALRNDLKSAEKWFAMVDDRSPSIPTAATEWGEILMHKGDYAGAIAKFAESHRKSARFADPLEMWGEALMQQNRSDLALAKFEEASHYAPNWGRLHLKWGEALVYSGRKDEARAQFEMANGLGLNARDRARLARDRSV